jgi:hypothetical protein
MYPKWDATTQWCTQDFFGGGGAGRLTNSVEDRGHRERGTGGSSPFSGVPLHLQVSETHILIRLLRMYFPWNWEFGSALSKLWNFKLVGGGSLTPQTPYDTPLQLRVFLLVVSVL